MWGDGYLSVPVSLANGRTRAYGACSRCGRGCSVFFLFFFVAYHFAFPPPLSLGWMGMDDVILRPFH